MDLFVEAVRWGAAVAVAVVVFVVTVAVLAVPVLVALPAVLGRLVGRVERRRAVRAGRW